MAKIVALALVCAIIILYLRSINSEYTFLAVIASGIILTGFAFSYVENVFIFVEDLANSSGINSEVFKILMKITGIGYLIEFGASTIEDFGLKSIADKLVFIGKIIIITLSMPIIYSFLNIVTVLVQ